MLRLASFAPKNICLRQLAPRQATCRTAVFSRSALSRRYASDSASSNDTGVAYDSNERTETNQLEKTLTKFWEKVTCKETAEGYQIQLDGKTIKTPLGFELTIPANKPTLAYLLTNEWKSLPSLKVRPYLVPLTSLASRAIDLANCMDDAEAKAKVGDLVMIKTLLLNYLDTDTLLVFSPQKDCSGKLRIEQEKLYRPFLKNMEEFFSKYSDEPVIFEWLDTEKGFALNLQTENTTDAVTKYLNSLNMWQLVALERTTLTCKSFLCGVAVCRMNDPNDDFRYTTEDLANLSTLETTMQQDEWGEVEDTHDVEKVDVRRHISSSSILAYTKDL